MISMAHGVVLLLSLVASTVALDATVEAHCDDVASFFVSTDGGATFQPTAINGLVSTFPYQNKHTLVVRDVTCATRVRLQCRNFAGPFGLAVRVSFNGGVYITNVPLAGSFSASLSPLHDYGPISQLYAPFVGCVNPGDSTAGFLNFYMNPCPHSISGGSDLTAFGQTFTLVFDFSADADGDNVPICGGDCDDNDATVSPNQIESCDGKDNNCNGQTDEGLSLIESSCGVGACASTGSKTCVNGVEADSCQALPQPSEDDASCDGVDNDCDGLVDEDYVSTETSCGVGACASTGSKTCVNGVEEDSCQAIPQPSEDDASCDGVDNDCDGLTDEEYASTESNCGLGACANTGVVTCVNGVEENSCQARPQPSQTDATCDGVDDNCNGETDEGYVALQSSCGVGACHRTVWSSCNGGVEETPACEPGAPQAETCGGEDLDCNGVVDDADADGDDLNDCNGDDFCLGTTEEKRNACRRYWYVLCENGTFSKNLPPKHSPAYNIQQTAGCNCMQIQELVADCQNILGYHSSASSANSAQPTCEKGCSMETMSKWTACMAKPCVRSSRRLLARCLDNPKKFHCYY